MRVVIAAALSCFLLSPAMAQAPTEDHLPPPTHPSPTITVYTGCLSGSAFARVPIFAGQRVEISADKTSGCDSRGWTNFATNDLTRFSGPEGRDTEWPGGLAAGGAMAPMGLLIGAISPYNIPMMSQEWWTRLFQNRSLLVGKKYVGISPTDGYLYLLMNDGWGYTDNLGSISVTITITK
jgi:hypothetical protein